VRLKLFTAICVVTICPCVWAQGPQAEKVKQLHKDVSMAVINNPGILDDNVPSDPAEKI
jgi:hypothetical protein